MKKKIFAAIAAAMALAVLLTGCLISEDKPSDTATDPVSAVTDMPSGATAEPTSEPAADPTEAPTDAPAEAPTDAPTDAPTEAPGPGGDLTEFYKDLFRSGNIKTEGEGVGGTVDANGLSFYMEMMPGYMFISKDDSSVEAFTVDNTFYVYVSTAGGEGEGEAGTGSAYSAVIPEGENDPLDAMSLIDTEDLSNFEDAAIDSMEYVETIEYDGVKYDVVMLTTTAESPTDPSVTVPQEGYLYFNAETHELAQIDVSVTHKTTDEEGSEIEVTEDTVLFFFPLEPIEVPADITFESVDYETLSMTFFFSIMGIIGS